MKRRVVYGYGLTVGSDGSGGCGGRGGGGTAGGDKRRPERARPHEHGREGGPAHRRPHPIRAGAASVSIRWWWWWQRRPHLSQPLLAFPVECGLRTAALPIPPRCVLLGRKWALEAQVDPDMALIRRLAFEHQSTHAAAAAAAAAAAGCWRRKRKDSPSHRILRHMHEVLNIDKSKN